MAVLWLTLGLGLGLGLGALLGALWARSRAGRPLPDDGAIAALEQRAADQAVLREGLERLGDQMRDLEHDRSTWQGQFAQQVADIRLTAEGLRRETGSLATALRRPQVRGRWGELHLRRAVELAGMVAHCDFEEQAQLDDGALRPDIVVRLAGERTLAVDAKVPLDAFLDATSTDDPDQREAHLHRHARQLRRHVDQLAAKRYWRSLEHSPEFVVLFVPAESFFSAALETQPDLIDYAAARQVVIATPTTLIALLRTVAHGWRHLALTERTRDIHELGRDLHHRLSLLGGHLDAVGRSLNATVGHYNAAVGSLESRVLVTARRFEDLQVTDDQLATPRQVDSAARSAGTPLHSVDRRAAGETSGDPPTVASWSSLIRSRSSIPRPRA